MSDKRLDLTAYDVCCIPKSKLPLFAVTNNLKSLLSLQIRNHTKGYYSHGMTMILPGVFASQGIFFRPKKAASYLNNSRIKLWHNISWSNTDKRKVINEVAADLCRPWWKMRYDVIGCFIGQGLGITKLQVPWLEYCSENVARYIGMIDSNAPKRPSPVALNSWFKEEAQFKNGWRVYGVYDPD